MDGEARGHDKLESVLKDLSSAPCNLPSEFLRKITNNFSDKELIGEGGFGKVYKGVLQNGKTVAVKKLKLLKPGVQEKQFENEVSLLMRLKHQNIVRFVGYCYEAQKEYMEFEGSYVFAEVQQMFLCLEYMSNGSLDRYISDQSSGLDWGIRYEIIKGVCYGIHYLHEECKCQINASIIHMDLKPANILLDDNMVPKVADFGLSRLFGEEQIQAHVTSSLTGTLGYMPPEYIYKHEITVKADIYSLGVIVIEVITGSRIDPFYFMEETSCNGFVEDVLQSWRKRPKALLSEAQCEQIKCCIEIGLSCIKVKRNERPTTGEIIKRLNECEITSCFVNNEERPQEDEVFVDAAESEVSPAPLPSSSGLEKISYQGETKTDNERLEENQDTLIISICQDLGFSNGRPIAACIMYRCLLRWRSFEDEKTSIFNHILQIMACEIEAQDNKKLAYWLSFSSTLQLLLQRSLKTTGVAEIAPYQRLMSLFGSMSAGFRASPSHLIGGLGDRQQVEAKYPAVLFKQQLTAFLEKIYGMMRDNMKKEISPLLGLCIQAPRISRASLIKGSRYQAQALAQQKLIGHWQNIVKILTNYLNISKENYVPAFLIRNMFRQVFSFLNVQLFNSLLLRRECCSFGNGEYVKAGLADLEEWCYYATEEFASCSLDELKHIRQAVGFLVIHHKSRKTLKEITTDLCPALSIQQLYRISTMYLDDKYGGTDTVSSEVISAMRIMMTEDSNTVKISSFLLDDDDSIPFSMDDLSKSVTQLEATDVELPPSIRNHPDLAFLHQK